MSEISRADLKTILLFAVLMTKSTDERRAGLLGFSSSMVLEYSAGLFFVLIVSHIYIRQKLAAQGIIYLEYFYFIMYIALLLVSTDSIVFAIRHSRDDTPRRSLPLAQVAYWPLITGTAFALTRLEFY